MALIGVTASHAEEAVPYIASIERRGGAARLVTPSAFMGVSEALEGVSGLLLCGGYDVHPRFYGEEVDASANVETWPERDEMEFALLRQAIARQMPTLAICRGMQLMNVAFGGKLIQDLPDHGPGNGVKDGKPTMHQVYVSPGSKLGAIIGAGAIYRTNSWHHQGLTERHRAPTLLASAYHPQDGVIEALESPDHKWLVGVQCHPEREAEVPKSFLKLFDWLVGWAEQYETGAIP